MDKNLIEGVIDRLESIKNRPQMFFGSDDNVEAADNFFRGFNSALAVVVEPQFSRHFDWEARKRRGWELTAGSISTEMRGKGYSDKAIVAEIIEVELEAWRSVAQTA
jgi:hypothetical protein